MITQFLINGIITGLLYSLASIGFALVYNTTRIFHIALAVLYVIAAYVFWQFSVVSGLPVLASILISVALTVAVSIGIERFVYFPLHKTKASLNVVLVSSIGVFTVLTNVVAIIWGNETKTFSSGISDVYDFAGIIVTDKQWTQLIVSGGFIAIFFVFLNLTRTGLRIKAVRDDSELFQAMGFSLSRIRIIVFMLSGLAIAVASCLTAWDIGMDPYVGMPVLLNAVVALIIGGTGNFRSCIIGGILLGILQALVVWQWSAQWQEAITFAVLLIFLFFRPQGIAGEKRRVV